MNVKFHLVQFPQKVVGKLQIRLVDFIYQKHHLLVTVKSFPQLAQFDIAGNIVHTRFSKLPVVEPLDGIVYIEPLLRFGSGFDIPYNQLFAKRRCNRLR